MLGMVAPRRCRPTAADALAIIPRLLPAVGPVAFARIATWLGQWGRRDPDELHWHLGPVGVDRHLQGRGIGNALMVAYRERLDRQGGVGYLETDKPENVRFYLESGFETIGEAPVLGVTNWFMRRAPRQAVLTATRCRQTGR